MEAVSLAFGERATFVTAKVAKAMRPARRFRQHPVAETALRFSRQAGRRELAHPCAQTCAPCSRLPLRCSASCKGAKELCFGAGHPWPCPWRQQAVCFVSPCAQEVRQTGAPRTRRAGDGSVRRMAYRMCASSPQAQGGALGEPRRPIARPEHRDVLRTCSRGRLLFGYFLLATQEKVARAVGRRERRQGCRTATR